PYTVGAIGFDLNNPPTKFVFPDYPNDPNGWSLASVDATGDFRNVTTFYADDIKVFETVEVEFIDYVYLDKINDGLDAFNFLGEKLDLLKEEFLSIRDPNANMACDQLFVQCLDDCVWPGDVNNDQHVSARDIVHHGVNQFNNTQSGLMRAIRSDQWFPFESDNWSASQNNINLKHGDCDGDGKIASNDISVIEKNFELKTPQYTGQIDDIPPAGFDDLIIRALDSMYVGSDANVFDRLIDIHIVLAATSNDLTTPIHGISFDLTLDTSKFYSFSGALHFVDPFEYSFNNLSFSAAAGTNNFLKINNNVIQYAYTNLDSASVFRPGQLERLSLISKEGLTTDNPDGRDTVSFSLTNVFALNESGDTVYLKPVNKEVIFTGLEYDATTSSEDLTLGENLIELYPNPATSILNIKSNSNQALKGIMYDSAGIKIAELDIDGFDTLAYDLNRLSQGIYFIAIRNTKGQVSTHSFVKY
ncbi:MAG: T9SS type A sorting domain-containing protein, partial [Saprospiraceae bacterium]|nr:T9SS type A sorting domain-containing protein [Saprospiraceae bacterium]